MGKIAVIGSNSFTGSHFVKYLLRNTSDEVIGISRSPEKNPLFLPYATEKSAAERFKFFQVDMRDTPGLMKLFDEERPKVIANFAAQSEVKNSWLFPEQWFETNASAIIRIGQALQTRDYLERYLAVSTPEVYGSTGENAAENNNFNPTTPYAVSKLAGELFLKALHVKNGFPVVFTRAANVYGPGQQLYRIIPKVIVSLKKGEKIHLNNAGRSKRAFLYADDDASGNWAVIRKGKLGEVYHLSPEGELITMKGLVKKICESMERDFDASVIVEPENKWRDALYSLNSAKALKHLAWKPDVTLERGIEMTKWWIGDNWDRIKNMPMEYEHKN